MFIFLVLYVLRSKLPQVKSHFLVLYVLRSKLGGFGCSIQNPVSDIAKRMPRNSQSLLIMMQHHDHVGHNIVRFSDICVYYDEDSGGIDITQHRGSKTNKQRHYDQINVIIMVTATPLSFLSPRCSIMMNTECVYPCQNIIRVSDHMFSSC